MMVKREPLRKSDRSWVLRVSGLDRFVTELSKSFGIVPRVTLYLDSGPLTDPQVK